MHNKKKIGVVIPCYKARKTIIKVLNSLPNYVDLVVLVDDKCPEKTGDFVEKSINKKKKKKISILYNELNSDNPINGQNAMFINFLYSLYFLL